MVEWGLMRFLQKGARLAVTLVVVLALSTACGLGSAFGMHYCVPALCQHCQSKAVHESKLVSVRRGTVAGPSKRTSDSASHVHWKPSLVTERLLQRSGPLTDYQ
jgi:hypothetical protein